ncbi:MAG: hypothetical protein R6U50_00615 [Desulfobacterales bacterium]
MGRQKSTVQLIWGWALVIVGIMVFFRIPEVMPKIEQIRHYSRILPYIKFSLYMMGVFLVVGGGMKIIAYYRPEGRPPKDEN